MSNSTMLVVCSGVLVLLMTSQYTSSQQHGETGEFYTPQTFRSNIVETMNEGLFRPQQSRWSAQQQQQGEHIPAVIENRVDDTWTRPEPWRSSILTKEQTASILHHKQALSADGNFRLEYSSDNGIAAGEVIAPDGTRTGAYQYKDPSGQLVKLKYRAGKDGFQILEGSHLPKSPEPIAYPSQGGGHYQEALQQQRQQYQLQQQYNNGERTRHTWRDDSPSTNYQGYQADARQVRPGAGNQYFVQNWAQASNHNDREDDGQYRENSLENQDLDNKGPHTFGEGYAFEFKG